MQGFDRREILKAIIISAVTAGLATTVGSLSFGADEVDWFQNVNRVKTLSNKTPKKKVTPRWSSGP